MEKYIKNKYVIGTIILAAVCIVLAIVSGNGGNSPEGAVHRLERAINSNNDEKLLKCYSKDLTTVYNSARVYDKSMKVRDFVGVPDGKIKFLVDSVEDISGTEAKVSYIELFTDQETRQESVLPCTLRVIKENGTWVVQY